MNRKKDTPTMREMHILFAATAVACLASCSHFNELRYSDYESAMQIPRRIADPPVFNDLAIPEDLPPGACYAAIHGDFPNPGLQDHAYSLRAEALKRGFEPDYMLVRDLGASTVGAVSQYVGMGASFSTPVYRHGAVLWCFRLYPSSVGYKCDTNQMLLAVDEVLRTSAGIQEGDTILSINGKPVKPPQGGTSPASSMVLKLQPGQDVELVWIRPGTGRMTGKARSQAPSQMTAAPSMLNTYTARGAETPDG